MLFEQSLFSENVCCDEKQTSVASRSSFSSNGMCDTSDTPTHGDDRLDALTAHQGKKLQQTCNQKEFEEFEELIRTLGALNLEHDYWLQTASNVKSNSAAERYEGTKQFRMMLSVNGDIPIQAVIDTGIVPKLVEFISNDFYDASLQFEAAWALTNIASGTGAQTEVVVSADAVPQFIRLLSSQREDIREQGMWGLGNIAGDRPEYRDLIIDCAGSVAKCIEACRKSRRTSTTRTGVWSLSNLCRGKPRPKFASVAPAIPYLARVLHCSTDNDTLSDACWALDGLSEHVTGVSTILSNGIVPILCRLLSHRDSVVQRPALRVIGQIAAGDVQQTQDVIDHGVLPCLKALLESSRKSIRRDVCWSLSNIAAGSTVQLEAILSAELVPKLVEVFHSDNEIEVKKEAAWAICNACTSRKDKHLEYLITHHCVQPVCEMLTIDDPKILEVALEALENILEFGRRMQKLLSQPGNVSLELVRQCDGFTHLSNLHHVTQGFGSFVVWERSGQILQHWASN